MSKVNIKNEQVKRKFYNNLKNAEGCCESTITCVEKAILLYEDFTEQKDFASFSINKAVDFKKWLSHRKYRGKTIALTSYHAHLRNLRKFFIWLSGEPGYKSKITPDKIAYLKILKKEARVATQTSKRRYPQIEYVKNLTGSIKVNTEIDRRDQALIAFTLLTGMRDKAIATLPISCFDENTLTIRQDPRMGVETKFSKYITSSIFPFDKKLLDYFLSWASHLKSKGFSSADPLFPRSKQNQTGNNLSFETATEVEPVFWKGTGCIREIFKKRAKDAGLPYFPPHSFRHLAIDLALKSCKTGEQIKAVSQNFGHENVATTMYSYANYDDYKLNQIIKSMNFSGRQIDAEQKKLDLIRKILVD